MPRPLPFDPAEYTKTTAPVVDAFTYSNGDISTTLTDEFIDKTCRRMNERFESTGDLCPLVVGHTIDGAPEHDQPQKVGYLSNWRSGDWNGKRAAFADHWIKNDNTLVIQGTPMKLSAAEVATRFPRRSGEIWFGRYEVDPHCLLGATTPHRDLGILRLSADGKGAVTYNSPGTLSMAEPATPAAPTQDTGPFKNLESMVMQLTAQISALTEMVQGLVNPGGAKPGGEGGDRDADFEEFMKQLDAEGGGEGGEGGEPKEEPKGEPKEPKEPEKPKEDEEKVKLQRERDEAVTKLARADLVSELSRMKNELHLAVDPADDALIRKLLALPSDMRDDVLKLMRDAAPKLPGGGTGALNVAIGEATAVNGKKLSAHPNPKEEGERVYRLARDKGITFDQALKAEGYIV